MTESEDELFPTGAMFRAARGLLGLGVSELAAILDISRKTVFAIEDDRSFRADKRRTDKVREMRNYFEERGVLFLYDHGELGEGVRYGRRSSSREPKK